MLYGKKEFSTRSETEDLKKGANEYTSHNIT